MSKRNLLLCFDAFGTLFKPKRPIAQQYGEIAKSLGLGGFSEDDLDNSFKNAFKHESEVHPNYGRNHGMNAQVWWSNIIHNTFRPFLGDNKAIRSELAPRIHYRFASEKGYAMFPDVAPLLKQLPKDPHGKEGQAVVGIVTNSDDRVPNVLTSLSLRVSPLRYGGAHLVSKSKTAEVYDIDFSVMSYDVGAEKPDVRIYRAAEEMLKESVEGTGASEDPAQWQRVFVGDEYDKDVVGAVNAGWDAVLIDREGSSERFEEVLWLDDREPGHIDDAFEQSKVIGFNSLANLARWLPHGT